MTTMNDGFTPYSPETMGRSAAVIQDIINRYGGRRPADIRRGNYERDGVYYQVLLGGARRGYFQIKLCHRDLIHLVGPTVLLLWDPKNAACAREIASEPQQLFREDGRPFTGRHVWGTTGWVVYNQSHHYDLAKKWRGGTS